MDQILTDRERVALMVAAEAERLEPEYGVSVIAIACAEGGYDFALALRTYVRDGVPWYVAKPQAAVLEMPIERQLERLHGDAA